MVVTPFEDTFHLEAPLKMFTLQNMMYNKKDGKILHESFKRENMGLCEFYQKISYEATILDFQLLSLDL